MQSEPHIHIPLTMFFQAKQMILKQKAPSKTGLLNLVENEI